MIKRKKTRQIRVGNVRIGGGAPVSIQSMTKTDTKDVAATVSQIKELEALGCEIIRVAVKDMDAAKAIRWIKDKIHIPLVADIHFDCRLAVESIMSGADKIRLNPGNIKDKKGVVEVIKLAKRTKIPIRIGVNSGSLPTQGTGYRGPRPASSALPRTLRPRSQGTGQASSSMVKGALDYIKIFEQLDFHDIIISLKASDVLSTIEAYRQISRVCDYPLHLGVTAAGSLEAGTIKSAVGIGALLAEGIGDTIRVSLTGRPHDEVIAAKRILQSLGLKKAGVEVISCPTCGRCEVDLVKIANEFEYALRTTHDARRNGRPLRVAIMGCVVNGPGEAAEADIGIAAGKNCGMLFKKGRMVRKIAEKDFIKVLLAELNDLNRTPNPVP